MCIHSRARRMNSSRRMEHGMWSTSHPNPWTTHARALRIVLATGLTFRHDADATITLTMATRFAT